jgi:site-specific DNA-methyltransferase (adenine-specific)
MATLIHGDCLSKMKSLPDKSVDLFVCDLPYGCLKFSPSEKWLDQYGRKDTPAGFLAGCAWDVKIDLTQFWVQVKRLCKNDHTPVIMFCSTKFGVDLINSNPDWFRYDLVWNKSRGVGFLQANKMPMRSHEMMYVFAKKGANYYRKDITGDFKQRYAPRSQGQKVYGVIPMPENVPSNEGKRCVKSVVDVSSITKKGQHPTQKPAELYEWLITRYSKEGDTVLDPTAGSFASVFTAAKMGRKAIGIEMDDAFFAKAIKQVS